MNKKMLAFAFAALAVVGAFAAPADAGTVSLFSSTNGNLNFPFSPPSLDQATAGTIDNMVIGGTTPKAGTFTTISAASGFTGPVAATTLSASGAVTGAGFTALFASPPAIGGTAPAAVTGTVVSGASFKGTGSAPAVTGTGTPSIASGSTNFAGEVTAGASATSVVITFNGGPLSAAPFCTVTTQTGGIASFAYAITTSAITVTQSATSANKIDYVCVAH